MSEILKVKNLDILKALPNHEKGEIAFCEDTKTYYIYDEEWTETKIQVDGEGAHISLYELNRQIIEQLPAFEETQWAGAESVFSDWEDATNHKYYMLYGREVNYFTLFKKVTKSGEFNSLFDAIKECLNNIGDVHSFDITEDKMAIEIWVKHEDIMTCFYLFNYDDGVVTFNE